MVCAANFSLSLYFLTFICINDSTNHQPRRTAPLKIGLNGRKEIIYKFPSVKSTQIDFGLATKCLSHRQALKRFIPIMGSFLTFVRSNRNKVNWITNKYKLFDLNVISYLKLWLEGRVIKLGVYLTEMIDELLWYAILDNFILMKIGFSVLADENKCQCVNNWKIVAQHRRRSHWHSIEIIEFDENLFGHWHIRFDWQLDNHTRNLIFLHDCQSKIKPFFLY